MAERGRAILLEEEVADPGKAVTAHERGQQPPAIALDDGQHQQRQHPAAADEMQAAAGAMAVLAQVVRVELAEAGKARHGVPPNVPMWTGAHCAAATPPPVRT